MPTVKDIYAETIKPLSHGDREELISLILNDLTPEPLKSIRSREQLETLLLEGMNSPKQKVTSATWEHARAELDRRLKTSSA